MPPEGVSCPGRGAPCPRNTGFTEIPAELLAAKTAILAGSVSAALIGLIYMHFACRTLPTRQP